jgi:D-alanine-D-alanine ligase
MTERLIAVFHPFDYGRFEFRVDVATGTIHFLEVNLNCNLWSAKVFGRSAALVGFSQRELIETILAESLMRHGLC